MSQLATVKNEIKDLVVILPVVHLLVCAAYLMAYFWEFGEGVHTFASPTDLFGVSLEDVGPIYAALLLTIGALVVYHHGKYGSLDYNRYLESLSPELRAAEIKKAQADRKAHSYSLVANVVIALFSIPLRWYYDGLFPFTALQILGVVGVGLFLIWANRKIDLHVTTRVAGAAVAYLLIFTFVRGLSTAQSDRYSSYSQQLVEHARCRDVVIIRPLSTLYLAIGRDDQHYIVDGNCGKKFKLPEHHKATKGKKSFSEIFAHVLHIVLTPFRELGLIWLP